MGEMFSNVCCTSTPPGLICTICESPVWDPIKTSPSSRYTNVAALEASIPDAAALVFACLGIALALHGRRALRARALNLAAVGASVFMNAIAAAPGWRNLAIWAMPGTM